MLELRLVGVSWPVFLAGALQEIEEKIRMRVFRAALVIAFLAGPAYAQDQQQHVPRYGEETKDKTT
jgi:hypothetical protein